MRTNTNITAPVPCGAGAVHVKLTEDFNAPPAWVTPLLYTQPIKLHISRTNIIG